ncbi:fungal-specific transcription factor domain-containing protein [Hypoxylon trugodes]|uniref:fungal-specific transcription factor domain-containing protein n=1 Tax=Hypoxylon trugodes TaxID=326681 RepID=UPI00219BB703|nr:fungal-specific transcription factor domain-containing protein [Hypoxylon trugodes]KAI1390410.1 fungal-specific transcription factor domain-containing protein [Hypoxylon trugodes]
MDDEDASLSADGDVQQRSKKRRISRDEDVEGPACQSCRKKKAKCSRQQPCSVCVKYRTQCVYDETRSKPGMKTGAIENLSQRVASLEQMFLGQSMLWQQLWTGLTSNDNGHTGPHTDALQAPLSSLKEHIGQVKSNLSHLASTNSSQLNNVPERPKSNQWNSKSAIKDVTDHDLVRSSEYDEDLPPRDLIDALVEIYFAKIHPWIPMLHVRGFRQRMANDRERPRLTTIFHAIVSLCARFSPDSRLGNADEKARNAKRSKQVVLLRSMESFSVGNLQALIICAFDTLGSGRGPSAWSIVGSMTRTVEQLRLSVEEDDQPTAASAEVMIKRMAFLPPARTWSEREERRRVFWNIFLMDRFCSIATGWNFSLTSADVRMRLPCEGALWEAGQPLATPTPYFGVADQTSSVNGALPSVGLGGDSQESIGGFAYCIEATESLSLVTSFFLQQVIDITKMHEVQMWLMKFKELDLRLVQWKLYLPEQWREACVLNQDGIMDPNLTLAHVTHNTAVVLLHQSIAYPMSDWHNSRIRLPSASSSETCLAAATEVAIITEKFLQDSTSPTNPQFAFCLFICGRMLLAHASYYGVPLSKDFDSLVGSLLEMSSRWNGPWSAHETSNSIENLASKFAMRLRHAQRQGPGAIDIRQPAYSDDNRLEQESEAPITVPIHAEQIFNSYPNSNNAPTAMFNGGFRTDNVGANNEASPDSISLAFPPLPLAFQPDRSNKTHTSAPPISLASLQTPGPMLRDSNPNHTGNMDFGNSDVLDFEDLNTYLQQPFLPTQRISMFSEPMNGHRPT